MSKPEWGTKRKCPTCGTFFYDMKKKTFTCPKCKTEYKEEEIQAAKLEAALKSVNNIKALQEELDEEEETRFELITHKPIEASEEELKANNRSHSAKLRIIMKKGEAL